MTDLVHTEPVELGLIPDPRTGEVLDPADTPKVIEALAQFRALRERLLDAAKACEDAIVEYGYRRTGSKTIRAGDLTAKISGGEGAELDWDFDVLAELRDVGLPDETYAELVTEVVTVRLKAKASLAAKLEKANPAYAEIIQRARSRRDKAWRVSVS